MELSFDPDPSRGTRFPQGYWYARTSDHGHDAVGATPLDAMAALVEEMEKAMGST